MATLAEELRIKMTADASGVVKESKKAEKALKGTAREAEKASKKVTASGESMIDTMDGVKNSFERVRGIATLAVAAVALVSAPILEADDAFKELDATLKVAGSDGGGLAAVQSRVEEVANESGQRFGTMADRVKSSIVSFAGDVEKAMEAAAGSARIDRLELFAPGAAEKAVARIERLFQVPADAVQEMQTAMTVAGVQSGLGLEGVASVLASVGREATRQGVSVDELNTEIIKLGKRGLDAAEAVQVIRGAMQAARPETDSQRDAFASLNLDLSQLGSTAGRLGLIVDTLTRNQMSGMTGVVEEILGSSNDLGVALASQHREWIDTAGAVRVYEEALRGANRAMEESESAADIAVASANKAANGIAAAFARLKEQGPAAAIFGSNIFQQVGEFAQGFNSGGFVPGIGNTDTVPAMLTPGEFVIRKEVAQALGPFLQELNTLGVRPSALFNTPLRGAKVGDEFVLDILGIRKLASDLTGGRARPTVSQTEANKRLSQVAAGMMGALQGLDIPGIQSFNRGGEVQNNNNVTVNLNTHSVDASFVRSQLAPELARILSRGPSLYSRSNR